MKDAYIVYKCQVCARHFILMTNDINHSEEESKYITCPYHGKHKNIVVVGKYESVKECMEHDSYRRDNGRMRRR